MDRFNADINNSTLLQEQISFVIGIEKYVEVWLI